MPDTARIHDLTQEAFPEGRIFGWTGKAMPDGSNLAEQLEMGLPQTANDQEDVTLIVTLDKPDEDQIAVSIVGNLQTPDGPEYSVHFNRADQCAEAHLVALLSIARSVWDQHKRLATERAAWNEQS